MTAEAIREYLEDRLLAGDSPAPLYPEGRDIVVCPEGVRVGVPAYGIPAREYWGACRSIGLPNTIRRDCLADLIRSLAPLLARAVAGAREVWDGSKWVGDWDADAVEAIEEAAEIVERYDLMNDCHDAVIGPDSAIWGANTPSLERLRELWGHEAEALKAFERGDTDQPAEVIYAQTLEDGYEVAGGVDAIAGELNRLREDV